MKIKLALHATLHQGYIVLKELNSNGKEQIDRFFRKKSEFEERNKHEYFIHTTLELKYQHRTFKQNNSVWILVTAIFESMEGRLPDEDEKYALYLDLLEEYADKIPSRLNGKLRPVHISEANSIEGARFIDGLIYHLAQFCELSPYAQLNVIDVLMEWQNWRGGLDKDPMDYADIECTRLLTESEWREKRKVSEASGKGGNLHLHHIVSRGSNKAAEDKAWNWLMLTHEEHRMLHEKGDDHFLTVYPHLAGRFKRARKLASKLLHEGVE